MKFLMLRGQVPQDRNPQEIVFDKIEDCDDMWTQLLFAMTYMKDRTELWYWGGKRAHRFSENFTELWVPSFKTYESNFFAPDVIFCRGGFQEYHHVLKRFPNAIKIYYGAGKRFLPQSGFSDYDIILQDSPQQLEISKAKFPNALSTLYIKPAADNIFYPHEVEKKYDVCFPANGSQAALKGHKFVYDTVPADLKVLNLGNPSKFKVPENIISYRVLRSEMAKNISMCKVGIVTVQSNVDSCPRVIPEMMACGLPIIVLDSVRLWKDKYIESVYSSKSPNATGEWSNAQNFWATVEYVLKNLNLYRPRKYYDDYLNLSKAAEFLREKIDEVSI